jgi:hypothetical protein
VANQTYAADALRAIEAAVDAIDAWNTKLEKHTKHEDACAVVTTQTYDLALAQAQGFEPRHPGDRRIGRAVAPVAGMSTSWRGREGVRFSPYL